MGNDHSTLNKWAWIAAIGLLAIQFLPYLILGENAYIRIHDTLEGEWFWFHLLWESGHTFNYAHDATIDPVLNGLPRRVFPTGWSFLMLWVSTLGLFWGYVVNYIVIRLVAFGGLYLLLRRYWLLRDQHRYIVIGVALCFSWIPLFSTFGLSVAGQPLLMFSFLNLAFGRQKWWDYAVILLFPLYSSVVWAAIPVLAVAAGIYLYFFWKTRKWNIPFVLAWIFMLALYVLANFQLFELLLFPGDFVSHREEYNYSYYKELTVLVSILETLYTFFIGHYHIASLISPPILMAMAYTWMTRGRNYKERNLFALLLFIALFYGFYSWIAYYWGDAFPLIENFKFERIRILMPTMWFLLFSSILYRLSFPESKNKLVLFLLISQLLIGIASNDEFQHNVLALTGIQKKPSFREFYAEDLFKKIEEYIGKPKDSYRVIHVGMHPSISLYNGFYTLDSHQSIYRLEYKKKFRKIIKKELEKKPGISKEFNDWGNRCYILSAELGKESMAFVNGKNNGKVINNLTINTQAIRELGGEYLFSALEIKNAEETGLVLEKVFETQDSFWRIYVYRCIMG